MKKVYIKDDMLYIEVVATVEAIENKGEGLLIGTQQELKKEIDILTAQLKEAKGLYKQLSDYKDCEMLIPESTHIIGTLATGKSNIIFRYNKIEKKRGRPAKSKNVENFFLEHQ